MFLKRLLSIFTAATVSLMLNSVASAQSSGEKLPGFGEGYVTTIGQEYFLGRAWLMSFRRQVPTLSDPLMQDYVENLLYELASTSELKDRRLELILINNKSINWKTQMIKIHGRNIDK